MQAGLGTAGQSPSRPECIRMISMSTCSCGALTSLLRQGCGASAVMVLDRVEVAQGAQPPLSQSSPHHVTTAKHACEAARAVRPAASVDTTRDRGSELEQHSSPTLILTQTLNLACRRCARAAAEGGRPPPSGRTRSSRTWWTGWSAWGRAARKSSNTACASACLPFHCFQSRLAERARTASRLCSPCVPCWY